MEYVQRRYINADMHFPERCSSCIAQEMVNTNSNMDTDMNVNMDENLIIKNNNIQNYSSNMRCGQTDNTLCPGCRFLK